MSAGVQGTVFALALGLFLLPLAGAAASALSIDAASLALRDGVATARFAGAAFVNAGCAGLSVTGTAAHLHLEVDRSHADVGAEGLAPIQEPKNTREALDFEDAVVTLSDPGANCRAVAWLDPGMEASLLLQGAVSLAAATEPATTYQPHYGNRTTFSVGGPDLMRAAAAGAARVTGRLRLNAWEATIDVKAQNQSYHAVLGQVNTPLVPLVPRGPGRPVSSDASEAYAWLDGANLTWALPAGAGMLASQESLDAPSGAVDLTDATVVSPGGRLAGAVLTLLAPHGDVHAEGLRLVGSFQAASAVSSNGHAVSASGPRVPWAWWAGGLILVSAVGGRRWALHGMRRAMDADECVLAAGLALAVWPPSQESRVARVVCLLRLGDFEGAQRALHPRRWRSQPATRSFLQARLEASRGDTAAARRHLVECFLLAPAFVADARADLALSGIVEAALGRMPDAHGAREGYA